MSNLLYRRDLDRPVMEDTEGPFLKASWANVLGNVLKIVVEGSLGLYSGSLALVADATHSIADLLASGIVLVWGRIVYEDPDREHPHGHERFEPLAALFVGAVLVLLGLKLLVDSVDSFLTGPSVAYSPILVVGLVFSLLDMYGVYWYTKVINRDVNSPSLRALATDCLNDIYTTFAVLVGIVGIGLGYPVLDPIAGGIVSLLVIYQGVEITWENVQYLADWAPPDSKRERIKTTIRNHPDVHGIHDFVAYYCGHTVEVEFHAEIDGEYSLAEAHDIETELHQQVLDIDFVSDVHVHLDPKGVDEWKDATDDRSIDSATTASR